MDKQYKSELKLLQDEQKEVIKLENKWRRLAALIKEHDKNKDLTAVDSKADAQEELLQALRKEVEDLENQK